MLNLPHMAPLTSYAESLRGPGLQVPDFDPLDGGIEARVLFLFEKPGPMTAAKGSGKREGSGFISRDNDDPTAEAIWRFMREAEIPRKSSILWNVIPWWNGTRAIGANELRGGVLQTVALLTHLRQLQAIVFVGVKAARAMAQLQTAELASFTSCHPSPLVRARWPDKWRDIPREWRKAAAPSSAPT
jgi:hypothetical protein